MGAERETMVKICHQIFNRVWKITSYATFNSTVSMIPVFLFILKLASTFVYIYIYTYVSIYHGTLMYEVGNVVG